LSCDADLLFFLTPSCVPLFPPGASMRYGPTPFPPPPPFSRSPSGELLRNKIVLFQPTSFPFLIFFAPFSNTARNSPSASETSPPLFPLSFQIAPRRNGINLPHTVSCASFPPLLDLTRALGESTPRLHFSFPTFTATYGGLI